MPTPLPLQIIPTAYASATNPTITTVTLSSFGITSTPPGLIQNAGPPHLQIRNFSPALLQLNFDSSFGHYLGPQEELIVPLAPDDLRFTYIPLKWMLNPKNYNNVLAITYYNAGEPVPQHQALDNTQQSYDVWLGALDSKAGNISVPAAGASTNFGGTYSVTNILNIPCVLVLRSILLQWNGQGAAAGGCNYEIGVDLQTAGNVSVGGAFPFFFINYNNDWPAVAGPYAGLNYVLDRPWASQAFIPTGTADHFTLIFHVVAKTNAPPNVLLNVQADVIVGAFITPNNI